MTRLKSPESTSDIDIDRVSMVETLLYGSVFCSRLQLYGSKSRNLSKFPVTGRIKFKSISYIGRVRAYTVPDRRLDQAIEFRRSVVIAHSPGQPL